MSVKLIVVALLAATAVAADATAKNVAVIKECSEATCKTCDDAKTKEYTVGECKVEDGKGYQVKACMDTTDPIIVEGFKGTSCTPDKSPAVTTTCTATASTKFDKASCTSDTVTLFTDCTDGCSDASCQTKATFTGTDCHPWKNMFLKLKTDGFDCSGDSFTFTMHKECGGEAAPVDGNTEYTAQKACTGSGGYTKFECSADHNTMTLKTECSDNQCTAGCTTKEFKANDYTQSGGEQWYLDGTCEGKTSIELSVYASVAKYAKACTQSTGSVYTTATCGPKEETTTTTENSTRTTETDSTSNNETTSSEASTTTETMTNETVNETTNETTEGSGIIAPAHTAGVFALVLCLLACVY